MDPKQDPEGSNVSQKEENEEFSLLSAADCGSVADPDPESGAFLTPGSGIRNRFFPDPGSRIPDPKTIFLRA